MANQSKNLILRLKLEVDSSGNAKLAEGFKPLEQSINKIAEKTNDIKKLEAAKISLLEEQKIAFTALEAVQIRQQSLADKGNKYTALALYNLEKAIVKHNEVNSLIQTQISYKSALIIKEQANLDVLKQQKNVKADMLALMEKSVSIAKLPSMIRGDIISGMTRAGNIAEEENKLKRNQALLQNFNEATAKIEAEASARRQFHLTADTNATKIATAAQEKMYAAMFDRINARASSFGSKMASGTAGSAMIGGMTAAASINFAPIITNTDALTKNKIVADAAAKTHTNLFLRVGEAIGAYRVWNTTLMYSKEALMAIPKAGIELQSTKAALFGIFGSEQGAKNMQFLSELANNAGQSLLGLEQAYRRYAPSAILAGATQDEINKSFKEFAEVGTILHLPEDKLNSLFLALDQMFAKGVVQSEEIKKQLGNVLPGAVEVGAKAMEMTPAAFMQAMSKNLVTAKEFIPKFSAIYRETFGGVDDSVFNDIRTKLLSNLYRVQNEYLNINRAIFSSVEGMLNEVVKGAANALTAIKENLTGIGQALEIFAGLVVGRVAISIVALVSNLSLLASTLTRVGVAMAALTGLSNPVVLAITAITAVGVSLFASLNNLSIGYDKASGFVVKFKEDQVSLTSYIESAAIISVEKLKSAFEGLFNFELSGGAKSFLSMQLEALMHPIDTVKTAVFQLMSAFEALKASGGGKSAMLEAYNASMAELQSSTSKVNDEIIKLAKTRDEAKKGKEEPIIPPTPLTPSGENPQVVNAAAAAKALRDSYKDIARETKLATEETNTLLDQLASKYADNLVSIKDYYAKRVELQLANVEVEKTIQEKMIARASAAGDTATIEKARDHIELLNEKAKQFQPIADKERTNDLRAYNNTLASTTAQYLELTGATVAATNARLALQNAPLKQQLQTQIDDTKSTFAEKEKAKVVLGQVTAGEEITKINVAAEAAKNYRDKINEIKLAYTQMGATSSDVLTASLGGYAPLFNLFDNFQLKQQEMLIKMQDLIAEGDRLNQIKVAIPAGDTEALAANQKAIEINAKQTQLLDTETARNKIKTGREAFLTVENLMKAGSKEQKIMHVAAMAYNVAEKFGVLETLAVKGASAVLTQGEGDPYSAFARMAAMAALVASIISAVGGSSTKTSSTSAPVSDPAGSVFGDASAVSNSLEDTLTILKDISYKSYRELIKLNDTLIKTTNSIIEANKRASGAMGGMTLNNSISTTGYQQNASVDTFKTVVKVISLVMSVFSAGISDLVMFIVSKIPVVGKAIDKVLTFIGEGLFGKITIKSIDKGLVGLKTPVKDILSGGDALILQYETLEKTKKSWFSKTVQIYDVFQKATKSSVDLFTSIYTNMANGIKFLASKISESALVNLYKYKFSTFKISLLQKPEEVTKRITGLMNKELDKMALAVFGPIFGDLRELKEGMFATINRLFIQKEVVKGYFKDLGASFTVNSEEGIRFADALVKVSSSAATGAERLKEFAKQQENFFTSFATTLMKNNKTVADFAQGLSSVFNQGLSIDQVSKTKTFVDYNKARADLDNARIKSAKLQTLEANLEKAKTPTQIRNAQKKLTPVEDAYNAQVAAAQDTLTKATANYNVGLNGSIESYQTLKDIFFNTVATTGDFGAALIEVKKNLDLSTESGKAAFVMLNNLSNEFTKLVEAITQPIKNQITSIADSIDATSKEDLLKQLAASRDFERQKTISVKIQKLIIDKYNTEKTAINNIKNSFINLAATVKTLLGGDLSTKNPYEKLQLAQTEYTDLLAKSRSTDLTVASDAASKLGASAQAYLTEAKSYFGATAQYADIFNSVTTTLSGLSQTAESAADASTAQLEALGQAAIDELNNLASVSTQAILDTLKEGIKALDITDTTKIATDQLLLLAMKADNLGIAFDALIAKFNQEMGTPASNTGSGIQALMDQLTAARSANIAAKAAKDTGAIKTTNKQITDINAQIDSYNRGFAKGGVELAVIYATHMAEIQKDPSLKKVYAGQYADGGIVRNRGMSLVGERGPELIHLPIGTNVIKNTTTNRLLEDSNRETINILSDMRKELIILNDRMGTIERKTRLTKPTLSMA